MNEQEREQLRDDLQAAETAVFQGMRLDQEQIAELKRVLLRATEVAEHLFQMIPRDVWREHGADDGQGHYEGDIRAAAIHEEFAEWRALV